MYIALGSFSFWSFNWLTTCIGTVCLRMIVNGCIHKMIKSQKALASAWYHTFWSHVENRSNWCFWLGVAFFSPRVFLYSIIIYSMNYMILIIIKQNDHDYHSCVVNFPSLMHTYWHIHVLTYIQTYTYTLYSNTYYIGLALGLYLVSSLIVILVTSEASFLSLSYEVLSIHIISPWQQQYCYM